MLFDDTRSRITKEILDAKKAPAEDAADADVLKEIRSTQGIRDLPVIFLTAKDDKESVMKVVSLKPEKYLLKSMPKDKLISAIDDFFITYSNRKR